MATHKKRGGASSSPKLEYSEPKKCINIPGDKNEAEKIRNIKKLIEEKCVCKIIKNDTESTQIIKTLRKIAGFDLCGCYINLFRGSCYINETPQVGSLPIQPGGGWFNSCIKIKDIVTPIPFTKPTLLQLFYKNNGITLRNFLKQNKATQPLDFYIDGLLNIAKGIGVLQGKQYSHGFINLDNILITLKTRTPNMLLINLDKATYENEADPNPIDVVRLGQVIKDILKVYPLIDGKISYHIELARHNALHKKLKSLADTMNKYSNTNRILNIQISYVIEELQAMYDAEIAFYVKGSSPNGSSPPKKDQTGSTSDALYKILELKKDSSQEQIKNSYRILARFFHPDKNIGGPDDDVEKQQQNKAYYTEKMQKINEAYKILSDPTKREEYDRRKYTGRGGMCRPPNNLRIKKIKKTSQQVNERS
jgi:hypothetical protein